MTSQLDVFKGREIVARWCDLAEQRLNYLTELFESGRWSRFYGEEAFLENVREAKTAVESWRRLLSREASRENRPIDLSWLGRARTALPLNEFRRHAVFLTRVADVAVAPQEIPVVHDAPPRSQDVVASVQDLVTVAARYPLLRNTF